MKNVTRSRMYRGRIWCDGCALLKVMRERYLWIGLNSLAESSVWGRNSIKATERNIKTEKQLIMHGRSLLKLPNFLLSFVNLCNV